MFTLCFPKLQRDSDGRGTDDASTVACEQGVGRPQRRAGRDDVINEDHGNIRDAHSLTQSEPPSILTPEPFIEPDLTGSATSGEENPAHPRCAYQPGVPQYQFKVPIAAGTHA